VKEDPVGELAGRIGHSLAAAVAFSSQLAARLTHKSETHLLVPILLWGRR
jgi:hypothetical protein